MDWLQTRPSDASTMGLHVLGIGRSGTPAGDAYLQDDPDQQESVNPLRLLVVDDDRLSRIMTANLLKANHIEVAQAENGLDALLQCRARPFDVVLTDLRMPVMDGETMAFRLRRYEFENNLPPCRIVVLAASLGQPGSTNMSDGTFDAALEKPALIGDVLNAILG